MGAQASIGKAGLVGRSLKLAAYYVALGFSNSRQRSPFARSQSGHFTLTYQRLDPLA
jgi:hypothetical protein